MGVEGNSCSMENSEQKFPLFHLETDGKSIKLIIGPSLGPSLAVLVAAFTGAQFSVGALLSVVGATGLFFAERVWRRYRSRKVNAADSTP